MIQVLEQLTTTTDIEDHILLLNCSRDHHFISLCTQIMTEGSHFLRTKIQLTSPIEAISDNQATDN